MGLKKSVIDGVTANLFTVVREMGLLQDQYFRNRFLLVERLLNDPHCKVANIALNISRPG